MELLATLNQIYRLLDLLLLQEIPSRPESMHWSPTEVSRRSYSRNANLTCWSRYGKQGQQPSQPSSIQSDSSNTFGNRCPSKPTSERSDKTENQHEKAGTSKTRDDKKEESTVLRKEGQQRIQPSSIQSNSSYPFGNRCPSKPTSERSDKTENQHEKAGTSKTRDDKKEESTVLRKEGQQRIQPSSIQSNSTYPFGNRCPSKPTSERSDKTENQHEKAGTSKTRDDKKEESTVLRKEGQQRIQPSSIQSNSSYPFGNRCPSKPTSERSDKTENQHEKAGTSKTRDDKKEESTVLRKEGQQRIQPSSIQSNSTYPFGNRCPSKPTSERSDKTENQHEKAGTSKTRDDKKEESTVLRKEGQQRIQPSSIQSNSSYPFGNRCPSKPTSERSDKTENQHEKAGTSKAKDDKKEESTVWPPLWLDIDKK